MQSNMTHWLAYIGIIGNLHDLDLKAFSDIPDAVVNSSAVVGLDSFPHFAVIDVSLFYNKCSLLRKACLKKTE